MASGYPSGLTAGAFEMLLHYFYTPVDADGALDCAHCNYRAIKELEAAQLIELLQKGQYGAWGLTERGQVLARHVVNLPLPEQSWRMPRSASNG